MAEPGLEIRLRYPLRAWFLVGVAWCFYAAVLLPLALFMLPIVPLAPVFVMIMVALGGLLSSVHAYARSVATPRQLVTLPRRNDGQIPQGSHRAPRAS